MSRNPLCQRTQQNTVDPRIIQGTIHTGVSWADAVINDQYQRDRSSTDLSRHLANELRLHIRRFYQQQLHNPHYESINVKLFGTLPEHSIRAINRIDAMLKSIHRESQEKVIMYYNLISNILGGLEESLFPFIMTFIPEAARRIVEKVIFYISRMVRHVVHDRIGGRMSTVTKQCIRYIAKERLIMLMHNPIDYMTVKWNDEDDIFGEDNSFFNMLTEMTGDIVGTISFFMSIFNDTPLPPAKHEEPVSVSSPRMSSEPVQEVHSF